MIRARVLSSARRVTRYSSAPSPLMVPANTGSPTSFSTGRLSPVIGAWLTLERPLVTSPSSAMRSPGFTRTVASSSTCLAGSSFHSPPTSTVACSGASCSRPRMALRARSRDFASISSAMANSTLTIAASGHWPISMAPVTAMLIRALMFRLRFFRAIQPLR